MLLNRAPVPLGFLLTACAPRAAKGRGSQAYVQSWAGSLGECVALVCSVCCWAGTAKEHPSSSV